MCNKIKFLPPLYVNTTFATLKLKSNKTRNLIGPQNRNLQSSTQYATDDWCDKASNIMSC